MLVAKKMIARQPNLRVTPADALRKHLRNPKCLPHTLAPPKRHSSETHFGYSFGCSFWVLVLGSILGVHGLLHPYASTGLHSQLILSTGHPTWPAAGINGLWQAASGDNGFSRPADAFACLGACASLTRSDARSRSRGVGATQRRWPKGSSAWSTRETNNVLWLAHQVVDL